jgi:uncharacterized protein with ParB-like and HNH nuclease domain
MNTDNEAFDDIELIDESEEESLPYRYSITSYGADYPVDGLVQRLEKDVIFIPPFQRQFVWSLKIASRFIESLLLGLPVPGIFLSRDNETGKMLVIDGQQRLKSLQFFYTGIFQGKEFRLKDVQEQFEGSTYKSLREEDKRRLDDSIIHATIVKQDEPTEDNSSIFHIFERLNTGGLTLRPQEIRACIYYGEFNELLNVLNGYKNWRSIFGDYSKRLRDQELILRFFALYYNFDNYQKPIKEFLNKFMASNRHLGKIKPEEFIQKFQTTIDIINKTLGKEAFRPERTLNVAVYDAVMVALARRLEKGEMQDLNKFRECYFELLKNEKFKSTVQTATSDATVVTERLSIATDFINSI